MGNRHGLSLSLYLTLEKIALPDLRENLEESMATFGGGFLSVTGLTKSLQAETAALARDFTRAAVVAEDFRAPLEQTVRRVMMPSIEENFVAGGRPEWEPLAESTIARRAEEGTGDRPLVASGRGMDPATSRARWRITRTQAEYPSNWPKTSHYVQFHQKGTEKMPARPFGVVQEQDIGKMSDEFARWVDHAVIARMLGLR